MSQGLVNWSPSGPPLQTLLVDWKNLRREMENNKFVWNVSATQRVGKIERALRDEYHHGEFTASLKFLRKREDNMLSRE